MKYSIRIVERKCNKKGYIPVFEENVQDVLVHFLMSEVLNFSNEICNVLSKAIENKNKNLGFAGNAIELMIENGIASLDYQLDEMMLDEPLKLPVEELNELVLKWISDVKELKAKETK